jgi:Fe-S cluster assembly ATPase SufC
VDAAKKSAEECINKAIETAATDQAAALSMAKICIDDAIDQALSGGVKK